MEKKIYRKSSETQDSENQNTWLHRIDIHELLTTICLCLTWGGLSYLSPQPLEIPPNDSLSSFPYFRSPTIPVYAIGLICFPMIWFVIGIFYIITKKFPRSFRYFHFWSAIWIEMSIVAFANIIVSLLNFYIGRARPDFYARCGSEATPQSCHILSKKDLDEELRSFPSAHAASAMAALLYLSLFLQKINLFKPTWVTVFCGLFIILAFWIGSTQIKQYKHHIDDVFAGFFIAIVSCLFIWNGSHKRIFRKQDEQYSEIPPL